MTHAATVPALRVSNLSHAFGRLQALDDVSLVVERGAFVVLLGVNGAGKTTLLSLVTRLYDNRSGQIEVLGHDMRRSPGPALAALGVVFQSRALDADLTVAQNLRFHGALHGLSRAISRERLDSVLVQVGLADLRDTRAGRLSGGQARRAEIGRALLHRPELLLLDEATVGLDVRSRRDFLLLVRSLVERTGVSVLWVTHLLDEIDKDDRIVVLHKGRVLVDAIASALAGGRDLSDVFIEMTGIDREAHA